MILFMEYKIEWEKHSFLIYIIIRFLIYVRSNLEQQEQSKGIKKVYYGIWFGHGLVFIYGVVMYHFAENPEESVRIAGVTVPVSHLLNDDEDVYAIFYTDTFTNENMTNTQDKLAAVADELFIKTKQRP